MKEAQEGQWRFGTRNAVRQDGDGSAGFAMFQRQRKTASDNRNLVGRLCTDIVDGAGASLGIYTFRQPLIDKLFDVGRDAAVQPQESYSRGRGLCG